MVFERFDQNAQVALLKVVREVLDLDTIALTMEDVQESMILRDALDNIKFSQPAQSMATLSDGTILAHALRTLDPSFDPSQLDRSLGPSLWLTRKKNLLLVYKGVFAYIRRSCRELMALAKIYDIRSTVKDPDDQKLSQLVSIIVVAACLGENNSEYVKRIQTLDPAVLEPIMRIIVSQREECKRLEANSDMDEIIDRVLQTRDVDFAYEEEHASILFELETSRKQASDLMSRLEHLQQNHEEALKELNKRQDELERLRQSGTDNQYSAERDRQRILEQEDVIASQEGEIQGFNETIRGLKAQIRDFERRVQKMDDLNDQVTELRHQNTELSKKANAAERYKQKIESQKGIFNELQTIHEEKDRWKEKYEDTKVHLDTLEKDLRRDRKRDEEHIKSMAEAEREIEDLSLALIQRDEELASLKSLRKHDERVINELQQQLGTHTGGTAPNNAAGSPLLAQEPMSLDQELGLDEPSPQNVSTAREFERLQNENALLKEHMHSNDEMLRLRNERDNTRAECEELRRERTSHLEQIASLQKLNHTIRDGTFATGSDVYRDDDTAAGPENDKRRIDELVAQVNDFQRKLVEANAAFTVNEASPEAIEKIKELEIAVSRTLRDELEFERQEKERLKTDLAQAQTDLVSAYQSKDQPRQDLDKDTMKETIKELKLLLEKRTKERNKIHEDYNQLRNMHKSAQEGPAQKEITRNLERENRLMATAWYDLFSRIQSNHVVLQRRPDMAKAWINKQRQMVNATTPRR